jgi:transposase-like protein
MTRIARKSDGRRIFTDEFKREQIERVLSGQISLAQLSRKLGIARSLLQRWKKLATQAIPMVAPRLELALARETLTPEQKIFELERLVGKQTVELEFLRTELLMLRKGRVS